MKIPLIPLLLIFFIGSISASAVNPCNAEYTIHDCLKHGTFCVWCKTSLSCHNVCELEKNNKCVGEEIIRLNATLYTCEKERYREVVIGIVLTVLTVSIFAILCIVFLHYFNKYVKNIEPDYTPL